MSGDLQLSTAGWILAALLTLLTVLGMGLLARATRK